MRVLIQHKLTIVLDQELFSFREYGLDYYLQSHLRLYELIDIKLFHRSIKSEFCYPSILLVTQEEAAATIAHFETLPSAQLRNPLLFGFSRDLSCEPRVSEIYTLQQEGTERIPECQSVNVHNARAN